jgi:hypothetical protein
MANANAPVAAHTHAMLTTALQTNSQIKTRFQTQTNQQNKMLREDELIAAMTLLSLHDMHDPVNAGWFQ